MLYTCPAPAVHCAHAHAGDYLLNAMINKGRFLDRGLTSVCAAAILERSTSTSVYWQMKTSIKKQIDCTNTWLDIVRRIVLLCCIMYYVYIVYIMLLSQYSKLH